MSGAIPDEVLSTLICSECHKYLSVPPVKVYPNRQVKCGRCATNDDFGVASPHYALITRYLKFPCIHRYEGCTELLDVSQVAQHETTCKGTIYFCPFCNGQCPTGYDLHWHLKENHAQFELKNQEFLLQIDQGDKRHLYFHSKKNFLCFISCQFAMNPYKLFLDMATLQNESNSDTKFESQDLKQQFQLFSMDCVNSVCTTDVRKCSKFGGDVIGFEIYLIKEAYTKNLILCKFDFLEDQYLRLMPEEDTNDPKVYLIQKECTFGNVAKLLQGKRLFSSSFNIFNEHWVCNLEMTTNNIHQLSILTAHLHCLQKKANFRGKMTIRASSVNEKGPSIEKVSENVVDQNSKSFIVWDLVKNDQNLLKTLHDDGTMKDNCLTLKLRIKVEHSLDCKQTRIA